MHKTVGAFVLVALFAVLPAGATHTGGSCAQTAVASSAASYPACDITVSCPPGVLQGCRWTLSAGANGFGLVSARMIADGHAGSYVQCNGINSCLTTGYPFGPILPGTSFTWHCRGDAFAIVLAVSETVSCTAAAA